MNKFRLKTIFIFVIVLAGVIPSSFAIYFLTNQVELNQKKNQLNLKIIEEKNLYEIKNLFYRMEGSLNSIKDSAEMIDYLRTPYKFRKLIENRLYGRIRHLTSWVNFPSEIIVKNYNDLILLKVSNLNKSKFTNELIVENSIYINDQGLPNRIKQGTVLIRFDKSYLLKEHEMVTDISIKDKKHPSKSLNLTFKNNGNTKLSGVKWPLVSIISLIISSLFGFLILRYALLTPIQSISNELSDNRFVKNKASGVNELQYLKHVIDHYIKLTNEKEKQKGIQIREEALTKLASQLAHDIRSPLAALDIVTSEMENIPEDEKMLIRTSVQRIHDIANNLLSKNKKNNDDVFGHLDIVMLAPGIEYIISEKRVQLKTKLKLKIESNFSHTYGIFSKINNATFKTVLSNLINNAIESLPSENGKICIELKVVENEAIIKVTDNGQGIPAEILPKLGREEISYGKEYLFNAGSGLGLVHAANSIEGWGGTFNISSKINIETTVSLTLPLAPPPKWHIAKLLIGQTIVILDDEPTIHTLWKKRLNPYNVENIYYFTNPKDLKEFYSEKNLAIDTIFLFDYELNESIQTGLDLFKELGITKNKILVTSRFEEENIKKRCENENVYLIPKLLIKEIPIVSNHT